MDDWMSFCIGPRALKVFVEKTLRKNLESYGVKTSLGPFVIAVRYNDRVTLKRLSEIMVVDKSMTTRAVREMIEADLVRNLSDDSRKYKLTLTKKGYEFSDVYERSMEEVWSSLLADLNGREKETLKTIVRKMNKVIETS